VLEEVLRQPLYKSTPRLLNMDFPFGHPRTTPSHLNEYTRCQIILQ
jgi:hypothetical protein